MNKNARFADRNHQKHGRPEANSTGKMRFVYIFMLLLTMLSLFLRVSGVGRGAIRPAGGGTTARTLVFHQTDASLCEDLAITATGNAIFSNCGNGIEKQYALNSSERLQLQGWIDTYSPVNYDHHDNSPTDNLTTKLYLNGRGKQTADNAETQQMIDFAKVLTAKIASSP